MAEKMEDDSAIHVESGIGYKSSSSTDKEAGKFVKKPKSSSDEEAMHYSSEDSDKLSNSRLKEKYNDLLEKLSQRRRKNVRNRSKHRKHQETSFLAEKIRGWHTLELEKSHDHKEQYFSWLTFKSTFEANLKMYAIENDEDKMTCLRTKCKGFIVELVNSFHRTQLGFQEIWDGLQTQFYAPIDSGAETAVFYQMKQKRDENIFNFFECVTKQVHLCDFSESDYSKRIAEIVSRNCLNPAFFLSAFDKCDNLDKLKQHARNFHAALPIHSREEPVLAIQDGQLPKSLAFKRKFEEPRRTNYQRFDERSQKRRFESRDQRKVASFCKYCGSQYCNGRNCPARGKTCSYCRRLDHFERVCLRKKEDLHKKDNINAVKNEDEKVNPDGSLI